MKGFGKTHGPTATETSLLFLKLQRLLKQPSGGTELKLSQGLKRVISQGIQRPTHESVCWRHFRFSRYHSTIMVLLQDRAGLLPLILASSPMACSADMPGASTPIIRYDSHYVYFLCNVLDSIIFHFSPSFSNVALFPLRVPFLAVLPLEIIRRKWRSETAPGDLPPGEAWI